MDNDWFGCEPEGTNRHGEVPHPETQIYINAFQINHLNGYGPRLAFRAAIRAGRRDQRKAPSRMGSKAAANAQTNVPAETRADAGPKDRFQVKYV